MAGTPLYCTSCLSLLELPGDVPYQRTSCPKCAAELEAWLLPAMFRPQAPGLPSRPAETGQAACFNHPGRQAVVECDGCGRFLCGLCDIKIRERHWCPTCFDKKRTEGTLSRVPDQVTRYDRVALALTVLPILFCCVPALITVPISLFVVLKHWNAPGSERPGVRNAMVFSIVLGILQVLFLVLWLYVVFVPPDYRSTMGV